MRIADPRASAPQLSLWPEAPSAAAVLVRHSRRARRVAVRISGAGRVELVVPRGVSERHAWSFLESRAAWVRHHVERRRAAQPVAGEFPPAVLALPLLGETWRLLRAGGTGRARLAEVGGVLALRGEGDAAAWRARLLAWLRRRAEQALAPRLAALAGLHGFQYAAMRVRCQRTRWGSCSTRGVISLNLALLFQPEDVVRYLLCHELAHTRHMDHSARFWHCVEQCEPRWRELDVALCAGWRHVPHWVLESA